MIEQIYSLMSSLAEQTGLAQLWWGNVVMILVGAIMVYLALAK